MADKPKKAEITNPLENLVKLISDLVEFILINLKIVALVVGIGFLIVIILLMNFFNLFGL